ncbi:MAG TPA: pyridine nucleotide-disulfide oxidoreductase, partial [Bdellovibrionales bacterium]|nr:pyridine nucleotide-disulfide oxidoreductase [Bdellovibrionales bacterium]
DLYAASQLLLENNPLPAMTGRVCPHTCESRCNRESLDAPVSIRNVERFLGDYVLEHATGAKGLMKAPHKKLRDKVAIVGSGPAGLSAAFYLARAGYQVTVFDRLPKAGGMLAYSIPAYRLPKDLVEKQIAALKKMGIQFVLKTPVGKKELKDLKKKFKAVFLATGAWGQRGLKIDKSELLVSGMDFLTNIQLGKAPVLGEHVLVIGGGNVAIDVAMSAKRLGARNVTLACLEAREQMPAFPEEIQDALKEGVNLLTSWGPHQILESGGKVSGMELVRCTSVLDQNGSFHPTFDPAQKKSIEASQIILAIGQTTELEFADAALKISRGLITVDDMTMATTSKGVFAGGDVTSGPATVIHAIAAGRRAAVSIDKYLNKGKYIQAITEIASSSSKRKLVERSFKKSQRAAADSFDAETEAHRCLNCSCVAVNASDLAPVLISLNALIKTTERTLAAEDFFAAGEATCTTLAPGEVVREIEIPAPSSQSTQKYSKFRIRNAIDFPIVSLASVLKVHNGKFKDSRIVFGAVAPLPYRMKGVEKFLDGKPATEETAAVAMELAGKDAQLLGRNAFKLQIVRALLKRAVLGMTKNINTQNS